MDDLGSFEFKLEYDIAEKLSKEDDLDLLSINCEDIGALSFIMKIRVFNYNHNKEYTSIDYVFKDWNDEDEEIILDTLVEGIVKSLLDRKEGKCTKNEQ
jgi:hypothetical protein